MKQRQDRHRQVPQILGHSKLALARQSPTVLPHDGASPTTASKAAFPFEPNELAWVEMLPTSMESKVAEEECSALVVEPGLGS